MKRRTGPFSLTQVVETTIGYDRPTLQVSPEWIKFRLDFFHRYTLQSLLAQSRRDFRIFVQCGTRHRPLLEKYPWSTEVRVCFDNGRATYAEIDTDYLAITRIDSDDLFYRENLEEIRLAMTSFLDEREVLVYKTRIVWDMPNQFILSAHHRASSPFFTHIFPRKIYKNWSIFQKQHFRPHGSGGAGDREGRPLQDGRVCVIKHGQNISLLKRGKTWPIFITQEARLAAFAGYRARYPSLKIFDQREDIVRILADFGVREENIP
jgi:hypothetical protein